MTGTEGEYMKFVIIGDGAVGKTSMLLTYVHKGFPTEYEPTVMDNYQVTVPFKTSFLTVDVWDTAGQENFGEIRHLSYPNTNVFLVCYSCDNKASFKNVEYSWVPEMRKTAKETPFVLVGTKLDLTNNATEVVSPLEAQQLADKLKASGAFQCSALLNQGVEEIFKECIKIVFDERNKVATGGCCVMQ